MNYFQLICDFFNFKKIHITTQNMISLKNIAENLQINSVIREVNKYIDSYEEIVQKINPIEELFELLYKIDQLTVNSVKNSILNSIWVHSEENIKEFVAFLLQVIRSGCILQPYLAELIIPLDESSNEMNDLNLLKPFIVKQLLFNFYKNQFYCCFVYWLSKSGIISIDKIISQIISCDQFINQNSSKYSYLHSEKCDPSYHKNVVIWFYAELRDNDKKNDFFSTIF